MGKTNYRIKRYKLPCAQLKEPLRALLLGDLHLMEYGAGNAELIRDCRTEAPDLVLVTGDMITGKPEFSFEPALALMRGLADLAPLFAVNGNHETQLRAFPEAYRRYRDALREAGAVVLNNRSAECVFGGTRLRITGLELPREKYRKLRRPVLTREEIRERIGEKEPGAPEILLAHNPQFAELYFDWGAYLTVCGHFHGGVMQLPGNRVLVSPYGFPLPKYGCGHAARGDRHLIVTSGLGDHAHVPRIHNPMELVVVDLCPDAGRTGCISSGR